MRHDTHVRQHNMPRNIRFVLTVNIMSYFVSGCVKRTYETSSEVFCVEVLNSSEIMSTSTKSTFAQFIARDLLMFGCVQWRGQNTAHQCVCAEIVKMWFWRYWELMDYGFYREGNITSLSYNTWIWFWFSLSALRLWTVVWCRPQFSEQWSLLAEYWGQLKPRCYAWVVVSAVHSVGLDVLAGGSLCISSVVSALLTAGDQALMMNPSGLPYTCHITNSSLTHNYE